MPRVDRHLTAPLPVPLTLAALEGWIQDADEALKRAKIAESKKLLTEAGVDPMPIPLAVLSEVEQVKACVEDVKSLPTEMKGKATIMLGRGLTKGISEAQAAIEALNGLARSLGPLFELNRSCPEAITVILRALPETTVGFTAYMKTALILCEHLTQAIRFGIRIPASIATMAELESELIRFDKTHREVEELVSREGVGARNSPELRECDLTGAISACEARCREIASEKNSLRVEYDALARRLAATGLGSAQAPDTVRELRDTLMEMERRLAERHRELIKTLGEDAVLLVNAAMAGELPPGQVLDDSRLGQAIRRAADAGFLIKMEAPNEGH